MKKLVIVLGSLLVLVLAGLALVPRMLDVNRYRDRMQAELQTRLGRQVQLGEMNLTMFPPTFKVQNAVIGEDPKYNSGMPFAQTAELDIAVKLMPLLHKDVQVENFRMVRPKVELIRSADGTWNFSSIGAQAQKPSPQQPSAPTQTPELNHFQIDDGSVAITDEQARKPRVEYNHIDLALSDLAPGKPFQIALSAHLPGAGKELVKLDGVGGPIISATPASTPFEGTLQLDQVGLSGARQYLSSQALAGMDASLGGSLKFKNENGKVSTTGTLRMDNVIAKGKPLGYPIVLDYHATDDLQAQLIHVNNTKLSIGSTPFLINGTVDGKHTPPVADLRLNTDNASVADLVKLAEAFGATISPGMNPSGQLTANLTARGPLSAPAVAGTLHASQLNVKGVLANAVQVTLNMAPPGQDVMKTLTGKIALDVTDAKLTGVDMKQQLGTIGKFTGAGNVGNGATHVSKLTGTFDLNNGQAFTNDLNALTDAGTITATGTASLVDQTLNMKATAVLSKEDSKQLGGAASGVMNTALANSNGEMVIPVLVTGTIPSPKVSPDTQAMASMRMKGLSQDALGKIGGAGGALGGVTKNLPGAAAGNQQQNSGSTTQDVESGITGLFGGKKKK